MKKKIFISFAFLFIVALGYSQKEKAFTIFKTDSKNIYDICFTNKGSALAIADNNNIKVYSTASKKLLSEFKNGHTGQILTIDISKDNNLLVSGGKDSKIVIWDFINKKILKSLTYQKGIITSVKISPDGKYLASGGTDNKVYLYDIEKNELIHEFADHLEDVTSVEFSPDGKLLATASGDKTIKIYEVKTYKLITSLKGHKNWVRGISFSGDGTKLISCGDDSRIITWNISDVHNIGIQDELKLYYIWILSVDFNQDNKTYVFGGIDGKLRIESPFGTDFGKIGSPINRIKFKPNENIYIITAIATRGKGVMYVDARNMKN